MNKRSYRIIFVLLFSAVFAVLILQAYFLTQYYEQRRSQLKTSVYAALTEVAEKVKKKETFGYVQESIEITVPSFATMPIIGVNKETRLKKEIKKKTISISSTRDLTPSDSLQKIKVLVAEPKQKVNSTDVFAIRKEKENKGFLVENLDSAHKVLEIKRLEFKLKEKENAKQREVLKLINLVASEIHAIDTLLVNQDSIKRMIDASFKNKGLALEYEFAIEKRFENSNTILLQSQNFNGDNVDFEYNLSISNILNNYKYLLLQVPTIRAVTISSMKSILILSASLSLFVILAFYFAIRLIMQQKQMTELRNDFVNNMTHELKTPIATAAIALSALEKEQVKSSPEKIEFYHRILRDENEKINQHVERVLQLTLFEKGRMYLANDYFDLRTVVARSISNFALKAEEQQSEIIYSPGTEALMVKGDAAKLELAINNIVDNALKYGGTNKPIRIETIVHSNSASIYITDEGNGISKDKQQIIFDRFYRIQTGDIHDVKGFGLGLSFVKQIIEMHHGSVVCESRDNKGSTFIIQLPLYA